MRRIHRRINAILSDSDLSGERNSRKGAIRMGRLDDLIGESREALLALPLLMLPMAAGAMALLLVPGTVPGGAAVVLSTIAVAWYLLGGALSLSHWLRQIMMRRALAVLRREMAQATEPVWICDADGLVLFQNEVAGGMDDLCGRSIAALIGRMRADADAEITRMAACAARTGYAELSLSSGEVLALSHAQQAALRIWTLHAADAGAEQADGQALSATGPDFDALPVALLLLSPDGRIRRANRAARSLLAGRLPADLDEVHLGSLLEGPGRSIGDWIRESMAAGREGRTEMLRLRLADGRGGEAGDSYFQVSLAPDPADHPGAIAVLHDASALKTLEAQFVQSQKMQAIGQLAGGVAHDFNNLLTAIRGHCDLLMLRHDKADPDFADLDQISQNTNRAAALVGQLLAFSRKQTLRLETLDPRDTLADLAHLLNRLVGERIGLTINNDPALRSIRADRRQLEQVIMNLVVNARDAMPEGGDITVRTRNLTLTEPLTHGRATMPKGEYVCIRVTDEGRGIPPEVQDKMFEPFFTTKRPGEGTGLGLSTAYGIVKQTGGYIFCDSEPGRGTVFSLYFPAYTPPVRGAAPIEPAPVVIADTRPMQRASVLLVEDEAPVRAFAARALRLKGYEVHEADSAEAALDMLSDSRLKIDVFVTDVVMPGMDGPSWVRTALKDRPRTRVVFMSGYTDDIFGEGHTPVPNSAFLAKPFTLNELTRIVADQLAAPARPPLH